MAKRDRAAYMRAYRAKRAESEGVSAPPPIGELRDSDPTRAEFTANGVPMKTAYPYVSGSLRELTFEEADIVRSIQRMSQAERDRILRKLAK